MKRQFLLILLLKLVLMTHVVSAADNIGDSRQSRLKFSNTNLPSVERKLAADPESKEHAINHIDKDSPAQNTILGLDVEYYKKSAQLGNAEAQFQLGLLYIDDDLAEEDVGIGLFWIEQAAEQGHMRARIVVDSLEREDASFGC